MSLCEEIAPVPGAKTVRVKFVLKKRCAFGQQFLVVGDDPALDLWDPSKATALDWSEDHVWTAKTVRSSRVRSSWCHGV